MESSDAASNTGDTAPMSAQSLYSALGLSSEDVEALAKIPENEITVETLPYLIMQLKAKRAEKAATAAAAPDADCDEKTEAEPTQSEQEPEPSEKSKEKPESPQSSGSARQASSHDQEAPGKGDGQKKTDRSSTAAKKDDRSRKPSRERQRRDSGTSDDDLDDKPTVFPHICSICKIESNGPKAWRCHLRGLRHTKARAEYLHLPGSHFDNESYTSRRGSRSSVPTKRPFSSERSTGDPSMFSPSERFYHAPMPFTRVVVAKFPMGSVAVADLLELGRPFGKIVKHLLFPFKGFLEFSCHAEAKDMVNHYQTKPAYVKGNWISLCLSPTVKVIHDPTDFHEPGPKRMKSGQSVVCFSRLPPGKETEEKVLELAALFGDVRNSKFTDDKALIEMVDWRDADIMVKYYHTNSLRIQDKAIKVYMSSQTSVRESSVERSSSKRSDSTKSRDKTKGESSSSKSTSQSGSKEKSSEGEEGEKEKTEAEVMEKKEDDLENEEGFQVEDERCLADADGAEGVATGPEEEEEKEAVERMETDEDKKGQEEPGSEDKEEPKEKHGSGEDVEEQDDLEEMDFPENLDDFVTLDELDPATEAGDSPEPQDGKVVLVRPIRIEYREARKNTTKRALFKLASPFGKVVNIAISYYRHEALLELETVEKAREMVNYYKSSKRSKLYGRPVTVSMYLAFKTIEDPSGRTLFVSMIPQYRHLDMPLLKLIRPFGKITAYSYNRQFGTCYIQMETVDSAKRIIQRFLRRPLILHGAPLKITKCKKGDSLIPWTSSDNFEQWYESKPGRKSDRSENGQTSRTSTGEGRRSPVSGLKGACGDPEDEDSQEEEKDQTPLGPYEPSNPVGVHYVVAKSGFFCKLCNIFYTDEKRAKSDHCSSLEHYNLLKRKRGEAEQEAEQKAEQMAEQEAEPEAEEDEEQDEEQEVQEEEEQEQADAPMDAQTDEHVDAPSDVQVEPTDG